MPSSYTAGLGLEKIATGEQTNTWGTSERASLDQIEQAINGYAAVAIAAAGSTGSPNEIAISDPTSSATRRAAEDGRNALIELTGTPGATTYVRFTEDTYPRLVFIQNSLDAAVELFQGTYNASRFAALPVGDIGLFYFDGGGTSAATVTRVELSAGQLSSITLINTGTLNWRNAADNNTITQTVDASDDWSITFAGTTALRHDSSVPEWLMETPLKIKEVAAAGADTATYGQLWVKDTTPNEIWFTDDAGTDFNITLGGTGLQDVVDDLTPTLGGPLAGAGLDITGIGVLTLTEQAAAEADVAGQGQIWVKNTTPNELWFTDDAGNDAQVNTATGVILADGTVPLTATWDVGAQNITGISELTAASIFGDDDAGFFEIYSDTSAGVAFNMYGGNHATLAGDLNILSLSSSKLYFDSSAATWDFKTNQLLMDSTLSIKERAASLADVAEYGQLWVKNTTPNELWFTDDAGTDIQVGTAVGGAFMADGDTQITPTTAITLDAASGAEIGLDLSTVINQSGTAGYDIDYADATHTATGSGNKYLLRRAVGGSDVFSVNSAGLVDIVNVLMAGGIIGPATGQGSTYLCAGSTLSLGAKIQCYGESHPSRANDIYLTENTNSQLFYKNADATWSFVNNQVIMNSTLSMGERAASLADVAGQGQFWVKTATPNEPWFTDDAGNDYNLLKPTEALMYAIGDEDTAITTTGTKLTVRMPYAFTVTDVRASLTTTSSSGIPTFDINEGGTTILSTKLTVDAGEKTSTTAAVPAVVSDAALADDAEITFDVDVTGTDATGAKITLIGYRT